MTETRCVVTKDQYPAIVGLIRRLPAILSGRIPDENGISQGFRSRIAHTIYSLIAPNFEDLGRGLQGADGDIWHPLSPEYLAYGKRFTTEQIRLVKESKTRKLTASEQAIVNKGTGGRRFGPTEQADLKKAAGLDRSHRFGGATGTKGLLTTEQAKLWRQTYAHALARFNLREGENNAKAHAAAVAWTVVKKHGGKTKLEVFGHRQVQILVDTGQLRNSILPGVLYENGPDATYGKPSGNGGSNQIFDNLPTQIIVGSHDKKANWHHNAKSPRRKRRLWPDGFPSDWWKQILGTAVSGLVQIQTLFRGY